MLIIPIFESTFNLQEIFQHLFDLNNNKQIKIPNVRWEKTSFQSSGQTPCIFLTMVLSPKLCVATKNLKFLKKISGAQSAKTSCRPQKKRSGAPALAPYYQSITLPTSVYTYIHLREILGLSLNCSLKVKSSVVSCTFWSGTIWT